MIKVYVRNQNAVTVDANFMELDGDDSQEQILVLSRGNVCVAMFRDWKYAIAERSQDIGNDPRDTPERKDERAKWTQELARILRQSTASSDYKAFVKAADFLDPPTTNQANVTDSEDVSGGTQAIKGDGK